MITALLFMTQALVPPISLNWKERPIEVKVEAITWRCTLIDVAGNTFPINGTTPVFSPTDSRVTAHPLVVVSPSNTLLAGEQQMSVTNVGEATSFDMPLTKRPSDKKYWMTLFFNADGTGIATVHTRVEATELNGYYATGLCQSDFRGKPS